jgi:hypothetical protein
LTILIELLPLFEYYQVFCQRDDPVEPFDLLLGVVLEIDIEWVHYHHLRLMGLLLELHHLVLPLIKALSMIVTMNLTFFLMILRTWWFHSD